MAPYQELEKKYSEFVGTKYGCATNTGTAALHLALEALKVTEDLPHDAQVIVPDFTMYASGLACHYARLQPIFIDCDDNLLINLDELEKHFNMAVNIQKTKVIMVTHVYGRCVDMDRVRWIANKYRCRIIEDACEAQGAMLPKPELRKDKMVGSFDIGCWSFYRNKIVHGEEGGMITCDDEDLIKVAQDMKNMSFGDKHNYYHERIGFNYRMPDAQANLALLSLSKVNKNMLTRHKMCELYNGFIKPEYQMPNNRKAVWVYDMKHNNPDKVVSELNKRDIVARHCFKPLSTQPLFNHWRVGKNAKYYSENVFYVNVDPSEHIDIIRKKAKVINEICDEYV